MHVNAYVYVFVCVCVCVRVRSVSCPQACLCVRSRRAAMCTRVSSSPDSRGSALSSIPSDAPTSASRIELAAQKSAKRLCWRPFWTLEQTQSKRRDREIKTGRGRTLSLAQIRWKAKTRVTDASDAA